DGIAMDWGSRQAISAVFQKMVRREGFGDVLADGILIAAEKIGRGSESYAMHCKGLPLFIEDPIKQRGKALSMAVGPRGDHYRGYPFLEARNHRLDYAGLEEEELKKARESVYLEAEKISGTRKGAMPCEYEGKPAMIKHSEDIEAIIDAVGICKWATFRFGVDAYSIEDQARILSVGLGREMNPARLFELAERMRCLERAFSIREGLDRSQDVLPKRFYKLKTDEGLTLSSEKMEEMKSEYYAVRGWDADTGVPRRETLEQLGLSDVAKDLEKLGKLNDKTTGEQ
ncbi:MAG: aldehyde ferredoxin oxidoreductase C-terminal domain-containing protein, partial [Desulfatiglandales bacterium]